MLRAHRALRTPEPDAKCAAVHALRSDWLAQRLDLDRRTEVAPIGAPGRPARPLLVSPLEVGRRSVRTVEGRAALIHALAHIEFNAMNLGLDALYRFRDMPVAYYDDWVTVSCEEAHHFALLRDHLRALGYDYGDFSAHDGLWEMAVKTAHDALTRMALVPRVLEARGLDASPALIRKLDGVGDRRAVEILEIILRDEIGHVRVGNRWYAYLCAQRGLDPLATFRGLLAEYGCPRLRPPLNLEARGRAGFSADELAWLAECAHERVSPSR
jgi:uncharacterized ferritin-like protein (DUF455 family)